MDLLLNCTTTANVTTMWTVMLLGQLNLDFGVRAAVRLRDKPVYSFVRAPPQSRI